MFLEDISFRFVEIFLFLSFYALYRLKGIDKINYSIIAMKSERWLWNGDILLKRILYFREIVIFKQK